MALVTVKPATLDKKVARAVVQRTNIPIERASKIITWGADEHILIAATAVSWLLTRRSEKERVRRLGTHFLACSALSAVLPHILKGMFDQRRPDRLTISGHFRGIPVSGKSEDAFPSGHALHVGALASAATLLPTRVRNAIWGVGALLVGTRVVLLAHWLTDIAAGLCLGAMMERLLRRITKPAAGAPRNNASQHRAKVRSDGRATVSETS